MPVSDTSLEQPESGTATPPPAKVAVYFDGSCPMCTAEICVYRARDGADAIDWVDVSAVPDGAEVAPGLQKSAAMARFHVRKADGTLTSGAAAFASLWTVLPGFHWLGVIARQPGTVHALEVLYRAFLPIRPWLQRRWRRAV